MLPAVGGAVARREPAARVAAGRLDLITSTPRSTSTRPAQVTERVRQVDRAETVERAPIAARV